MTARARIRIEEEVAAVEGLQRAVLPVVAGNIAAVVQVTVAGIRQQVAVLVAALDAAVAAARCRRSWRRRCRRSWRRRWGRHGGGGTGRGGGQGRDRVVGGVAELGFRLAGHVHVGAAEDLMLLQALAGDQSAVDRLRDRVLLLAPQPHEVVRVDLPDEGALQAVVERVARLQIHRLLVVVGDPELALPGVRRHVL